MDGKIVIELDGKDYEVKAPTLDMWARLNLYKDLEQEEDFTLSLVSISTGIKEDQLRLVNYFKVKKAADFLSQYFINLGNRFYPEFEFNDITYKFVDVNNLSFGHFIDIDTFLSKDESYKKVNMNEFIAMLYLPEGETYNIKSLEERKKLFKDLEVKYLQGSLFFLTTLRKRLKETTPFYLRTWWKMKRTLKKLQKHLRSIGVGIRQSFIWLARTLRISKK